MIKNEDLISGKFYYSFEYAGTKDNNFIFKYENDIKECKYISDFMNKRNKRMNLKFGGNFYNKTTRLATDKEKHHLEVCIDADKYVEYEEAMKSYIKPIEPTIQDDPELSNILIKLLTQ